VATHAHTNHRTRKGHLTQADLAEGLRLASPSAFDLLDRSGSLESELAEEFAAMDANGDGVISFEEYKTALSRRQGQPAGWGPGASAGEQCRAASPWHGAL
jgi:Ca2+-binding EF-hand superfamily protein